MSSLSRFPKPGPALEAEFVIWPSDLEIHRIHGATYGSMEFNGTGRGNGRFSPLAGPSGAIIPTLYGGASFECASMESVFHDVPHTAGFKAYDKKNLEKARASIITPTRNLNLINLSGKALHKLGISRVRLLECEAAEYPHTRPWAEARHRQHIQADGLRWVSRQDDEAHALMLFGDRVEPGDLRVASPPTHILKNPELYLQLLELAQLIGVEIL